MGEPIASTIGRNPDVKSARADRYVTMVVQGTTVSTVKVEESAYMADTGPDAESVQDLVYANTNARSTHANCAEATVSVNTIESGGLAACVKVD